MHGCSRLGNGRSVTATTTPSPPSSPRLRHSRGKSGGNDGGATGGGGGGGGGRGSKQNWVEKLMFLLVSLVFKRRGVLLFAPVLYISGMMLYMGSLSFDVDLNLKNGGVVVRKRPPPGSVYRSPQVFNKLWPHMEAESNGSFNAVLFLACFGFLAVWIFYGFY